MQVLATFSCIQFVNRVLKMEFENAFNKTSSFIIRLYFFWLNVGLCRDRGATLRRGGGGGGTVSDMILGGYKTTFLTYSL